MANNYVVSDDSLTTIADAIREKGETTDPLTFPDGFATAIGKIKTGGDSVAEKAVNFRDYDGTVVYSYTADEFAELTAMPDNPDHSHDAIPLTSQGWNWSLEKAQDYVAKYGRLEVGQMYVTTDGKTHILIHIDADTPANRLTFYLRWTQTVSNGVTVDWGDGSAPETFSGTSAANHAHTYAAGGDYHITLDVTSGTVSFVGDSSNAIYGSSTGTYSYNRDRIRTIRLGASVMSIGTYAFSSCYSMTTITIPAGVTSIETYAFQYCYSMTTITIPTGVTSIGTYAFSSCYSMTTITIPTGVTSIGSDAFQTCVSLASVPIPDGVTRINGSVFNGCSVLDPLTLPDDIIRIGSNAFQECRSLLAITIPAGVTSIETYAFSGCTGISVYHLLPTTPPSLSNKNAFNGIASDCVMYVPYSEDHSILEAYKTATNWRTYASRMQEEPQA